MCGSYIEASKKCPLFPLLRKVLQMLRVISIEYLWEHPEINRGILFFNSFSYASM